MAREQTFSTNENTQQICLCCLTWAAASPQVMTQSIPCAVTSLMNTEKTCGCSHNPHLADVLPLIFPHASQAQGSFPHYAQAQQQRTEDMSLDGA